MNKINVSINPIPMFKMTYNYIIILIINSFLITSCAVNNKETIPTQNQSIFITGEAIYKDETFSKISSNVGRLQAMMCGEFVQYSSRVATNGAEYGLWKVNDNKDSVVQYTIPVGDSRKNGHWIYHHQIITSLPNDPIFTAFEKLEPINRDTIVSAYYKVPEGFNLKIKELNRDAFNNIELRTLKLDEEEGKTVFVRQNPLFFKGTSDIIINTQNNSYVRYLYEIKPSGLLMIMNYYQTAKGEKQVYNQKDKFVKLAMIK